MRDCTCETSYLTNIVFRLTVLVFTYDFEQCFVTFYATGLSRMNIFILVLVFLFTKTFFDPSAKLFFKSQQCIR